MMIRVLLTFALLICPHVAQADWQFVGDVEGAKREFDTEGAYRDGDVARGWDRASYSTDQAVGIADVPFRSTKTLTSYGCITQTSIPLMRAYYREDGSEIARVNLDGVELPARVVPGSMSHKLLELACKARRFDKQPAQNGRAASTPPGASSVPVASVKKKVTTEKLEPVASAASASTVNDVKSDAKPAEAQSTAKNDTPKDKSAASNKSDSAKSKAGDKTAAAKDVKPTTEAAKAPAKPEKVHWSYDGKSGAAHWHKLKPEFAQCQEGKRQSPIDIKDSVRLQLGDIKFDYKPSTLRIVNNGHTVQVNYAPGSTVTAGGRVYELLQFHFHKPAEERINGKTYDMVAHLVHKSKTDGRLLVVAVLMSTGTENSFLQALWNNLPLEEERPEDIPQVKIDINQLLPRSRGYFNYIGSLTTPPCTEGVQWVVLKTPVPISRGQISVFNKLYSNNARPIQAANGRLIKESL